MNIRLLLSWIGAVVSLTCFAMADEQASGIHRPESAAGIAFFESKIRPVLSKYCYDCHSEKQGTSEGDLQLDSKSGIREGGSRGAAVVPGDVEASWLLTSVMHSDPDLRMPPKREKLPESVINDLKRWIEMGAPDPRESVGGKEKQTLSDESPQNFWAYQRPVAGSVPQVANQEWLRRPLDAFILQALVQNGLTPSADSQPQVLLRRLSFDLTGLQPTPVELAQFLEQVRSKGLDEALEREVERLLGSPRFGERWGRHWLDVVRFAESSGTEANISFPYAWRYRDYVIDSVNQDVAFDRFLIEQIAGDLLPYENASERARLLIATGFLAVGPKNLDSIDEGQFRADVIDEQIDSLTRSILGSSVACARCHDHKFDPFSMKDYYALAGIFASTKTHFGTAISPSNRIGGDLLHLPDLDNQQILHASVSEKHIATLKGQLADLLAEQAELDAAAKAIAAGVKPSREVTIQDALRIFWSRGRIEGELKKYSDSGQALPLTMGTLDAEKIMDVPLLERGEIAKPKGIVPRAFPAVLSGNKQIAFTDTQSGRLELARWLASEENPLTARVMTNRIWHQLFGAGLVASVDNFGTTGDRPSHPELLDYLAIQFVNQSWSVKSLIREIVLSRTYRQASDYRKEAFLVDPENRYLWRFSKRRLQAESIRDAMLLASGELNLERPSGSLVGRVIGDKPISLIGLDKRLPSDLDGATHRSVYLPVVRDRLPEVLDLFDFAEPSLVTGSRETTNVPIQSLYLMNSSFIQERSQALATRIHHQAQDEREQVVLVFLICFGREPDQEELAMSLEFLMKKQAENNRKSKSVSASLIDFCQAILCAGEFRNLD